MARLVSIFLIFALIVIHGQISHAMFDGSISTTLLSAPKLLQNKAIDGIEIAGKSDECCTKEKINFPIKISYCQLDFGLDQLSIEPCFPAYKQSNLPGSSTPLISREPAFPLRPPIA